MHIAACGLYHLRLHVDTHRLGGHSLDRHRDILRPQSPAKLEVVGRYLWKSSSGVIPKIDPVAGPAS